VGFIEDLEAINSVNCGNSRFELGVDEDVLPNPETNPHLQLHTIVTKAAFM
jgi:hypothetical protein